MQVDLRPSDYCGISVFYDNTRHFDLCLDKYGVALKKTLDDIQQVSLLGSLPMNNELVLYIRAYPTHYYFGFGEDESSARDNVVASGLTRHLSTEVGVMSFTGVYFGLFIDGSSDSSMTVTKLKYNAL